MVDSWTPGDLAMTERMMETVADHWALVAAVGVMMWWGGPKALKAFFSNGGGDMMRAIVRSENAAQTDRHNTDMDRRFREHEERENQRFQVIEEVVFNVPAPKHTRPYRKRS